MTNQAYRAEYIQQLTAINAQAEANKVLAKQLAAMQKAVAYESPEWIALQDAIEGMGGIHRARMEKFAADTKALEADTGERM